MKRFIFFFIFCFLFLISKSWAFQGLGISSAEDLLNSSCAVEANLEGEPTAIVHGCVNILSGDYIDSQVDLLLPAADPVRVERFYCSSDHQNGSLFHGWNHNLGGCLQETRSSRHHYGVTKGYGGGQLVYKGKQKKNCFGIDPEILQKGVVNNSSGSISARTNIKNNDIEISKEYATLTTGSGAIHNYILVHKADQIDNFNFFLHRSTSKANGNQVIYSYSKGKINKAYFTDKYREKIYTLQFNTPEGLREDFKNKSNPELTVDIPDGRQIRYKYQVFTGAKGHDATHQRIVITEADRPQGPKETYTYENRCSDYLERVIRKDRPDGRSLLIDYHKTSGFAEGKVKCLKAPAGKDQTPIPIYTFEYQTQENYKKHKGLAQTIVHDALKHQTIYEYALKDYRLSAVKKYSGSGPYLLYSQEKMYWGAEGTSNHSHLISRTLENEKGQILFCRHYLYDDKGNILEDRLYGNLSGKSSTAVLMKNGIPQENGTEKYVKSYTYSQDGFNLVTSLKEPGIETRFRYHSGTDLPKAKYVIFNGSIKVREFFEYDSKAGMTFYSIDNGCKEQPEDLTNVTERKIRKIENNKVGLPVKIEEFYQKGSQQILLMKTINHYDLYNQLIQQDHHDANGDYTYSLFWEYNDKGLLTKEINALGDTIFKTYDPNGNILSEQGPRPEHLKRYSYDYMNRKVSEEVILPCGESLKTTYSYDLQGNILSTTDIYGNQTRFEYDAFGRATKVISPEIQLKEGQWYSPVISNQYDISGRLTAVTDSLGNTTKTAYTALGKPYWKKYADGSEERFEYTLKGDLSKFIAKDGSYTCYVYDSLSRPVKVEVFSPAGDLLTVSTKEYDAFHLISETDPAGYVTTYSYEEAGRRVRMKKEEQLTTYAYDTLGRQNEIREYFGYASKDYIKKSKAYDLLNRVIEEKEEDAYGQLFSKIDYAYDEKGNCIEVKTYNQSGVNVLKTEYNVLGQPNRIENALGDVTSIRYKYTHKNARGQRIPYTEMTDPMGTLTVTVQDAIGNVVYEGKKNQIKEEIQAAHSTYDANGNVVLQELIIKAPNKAPRSIFTSWTYDNLNRLIETVEAVGTLEQKRSSRKYNLAGQLEKIVKPDGVVLSHEYDFLGRLIDFRSSDNSIHYIYTYNLNHQPIGIEDVIQGTKTLRSYDSNNQLIYEQLANGWELNYKLDRLGRLKDLYYPDHSSIHYEYEGSRLKNIEIKNPKSQPELTYHYKKYDLAENLVCAVVNNNFEITYHYDLLGRPTKIHTKPWEEVINAYDKMGHPLEKSLKDPMGQLTCTYTYDDLYQLKSESGVADHEYVHDSAYNQIKKDSLKQKINALNQLLHDGNASYSYDANGNRIQSQDESGSTCYSYDALNRLVAVERGSNQWRYVYDPFNRRLSKEYESQDSDASWKLKRKESYFYLKQNEVGCFSENGKLIEKRFLGLGKGGEIGAAVLIDSEGKKYVPLHDHKGHVSLLLDASDNTIVEGYRYEAFGKEQIYGSEGIKDTACQPWRFSSKRYDPETGFLYFGERYYDPSIARWISPDPIGFDGGPNLYAYVFNNPLKWLDVRGLDAELGLDYFHTGIESDMNIYKESRGLMAFGSGFTNGFSHGTFDWLGTMDTNRYAFSSLGSMTYNRDFSPLVDTCCQLGDEGCVQWVGETMGRNLGTVVGMVELASFGVAEMLFERTCAAANGIRNLFSRQFYKKSSETSISVASKNAIPLTENTVGVATQETSINLGFTPKIVQGNKDYGLSHIMKRHSYDSTCKRVSKFNQGYDENVICDLINEGVKNGKNWTMDITKNNYRSIFVDLHKSIGTTPESKLTSVINIVVDEKGVVRTAYPF